MIKRLLLSVLTPLLLAGLGLSLPGSALAEIGTKRDEFAHSSIIVERPRRHGQEH